jgi:hypothetical protein
LTLIAKCLRCWKAPGRKAIWIAAEFNAILAERENPKQATEAPVPLLGDILREQGVVSACAVADAVASEQGRLDVRALKADCIPRSGTSLPGRKYTFPI